MFRISDEIRPLVPLYVTMFLEAVGSGLVASIINVVARNDLGCSGTEVGIIFTGYNVAQVIGSVGSGYLSDRIRRKYVLMISLCWAAIGYIMTAFADTFVWFLVSRIFTGFCGGFSSVAIAILSSNLPIDSLPTAIGRLGTVMSMGFAIGPLISTGISAIWPDGGHEVRRVYFFVASFVYLCACGLAFRMSRQITPSASRFLRESSGGRLSAGLIFVWISRYLATCGVAAIYVTQVLLWQDYFALPRVYLILMTTASGLVVSVVQGLVFPVLVARVGFHTTLTAGIACIALANCTIAVFANNHNFGLHFVCLLVFWTGIGCMEPGTSVAVTRHLLATIGNKKVRVHAGLAMGITSAMKYLAFLSLPATAGYLYDQYGSSMYFLPAGLASLGMGAVSVAWATFSPTDENESNTPSNKSVADVSTNNSV